MLGQAPWAPTSRGADFESIFGPMAGNRLPLGLSSEVAPANQNKGTRGFERGWREGVGNQQCPKYSKNRTPSPKIREPPFLWFGL